MMRSVFITGITGGIGKALAQKYLSKNYKVYGSCSRNSNRVEKFKSSWPQVKIFKVDHNNLPDVRQSYKDIFKEVHPNVLINSAGIVQDSFIVNMSTKTFENVLDTNLISSWIITKEFMLEAKQKPSVYRKVINISSISGMIGREGQSNYSLTKGGLLGLTRLVEHESSSNIISMSVSPGIIDTEIKEKLPIKKLNELISATSAGKLGSSEDVASLIYKISEDDIDYCNGSNFEITGGILK